MRAALDVGHRLDSRRFERLELRHIVENGAEVPRHALDLFVGELEVGELRDVKDLVPADGHDGHRLTGDYTRVDVITFPG